MGTWGHEVHSDGSAVRAYEQKKKKQQQKKRTHVDEELDELPADQVLPLPPALVGFGGLFHHELHNDNIRRRVLVDIGEP